MQLRRLTPASLPTDTQALARALIGLALVRESDHGRTAGRIVETEAYGIADPASHAFIGRRERNASMFLEPFRSYVYLIYGTHYCFNVTSEAHGQGAAVLVRALEPIEGIELMCRRRNTAALLDLCRGPGRLAQALEITRSFDGDDLIAGERLWLGAVDRPAGRIGISRRIGITRAANRRLRFYERGSRFVSGPRSLSPS